MRLRQGREPADWFEPFPQEPGDSAKVENMARFLHTVFPKRIAVSKPYLEMLAGIIRQAHRNGVFLAAFTAPDYRDNPALFAPVSKSLDSLLSGSGVPYLDFNRIPGWPLSENRLFRDAAHVNIHGAERISAELNDWLKSSRTGFPGPR